jgi:DNA helicase-2/ATP-dependent DNA helicase PcrA
MRAFEERFITLGLPYRVIGGPRFYERQEIRDAPIAYLGDTTPRPLLEAADDLAFERIVTRAEARPRRHEFDTVFLPGWEEGILPHQRSLDETGLSGLEEERRLAHVGITRAKQRALISFASRRLTHGMWNSNMPSRFLTEIPDEYIERVEGEGSYAAQIQSRFDRAESFSSGYSTPGWQRAQQRRGGFSEPPGRRNPVTIEGEVLARSSGPSAEFDIGERVFHDKFGYGEIMEVEGTKVTVEFDKAGEKKLVASFLKKA